MKILSATLCAAILLGCMLSSPLLFATQRGAASPDSIQDEIKIVTQLHDAVSAGDFGAVGSLISSVSRLNSDEVPSVTLARRAATVCGLLQNENQYARAARFAAFAVRLLAGLKEPDKASHVERLYWEGLLQGRYMDHKVKAVELLDEAAHLAPNDDRIGSLEQEFTDALAQFGR